MGVVIGGHAPCHVTLYEHVLTQVCSVVAILSGEDFNRLVRSIMCVLCVCVCVYCVCVCVCIVCVYCVYCVCVCIVCLFNKLIGKVFDWFVNN